MYMCVLLTETQRPPVLWAALWLHEALHTDVLTSVQLRLPATNLHHVTAAPSEQEVQKLLHSHHMLFLYAVTGL